MQDKLFQTDYALLFYTYSPALLLLAINQLRDRFEPENKVFKLCNWSLYPVIGLLVLIYSMEVLKSAWYSNLIPALQNYSSSNENVELVNFLLFCFIIIVVYVIWRSVYKIRFSESFGIHLIHMPFIAKICSVITVINVICIYFFNLNLFGTPQSSITDIVSTLGRYHIALFLFVTVVVGPIVEEVIFRGLLYIPLYRKVGRGFAIFLTALVWSQSHLEDLPTSLGIFIFGIILGFLYDKSASLLTTIVLHSFKNSWVVVYLLR